MLQRGFWCEVLSLTLYPTYLFGFLGLGTVAIVLGWSYETTYGAIAICIMVSLAGLEAAFPLDKRWSMTWASFKRDLKYIVSGLTLTVTVRFVGPYIALHLAGESSGPMRDWPLLPAVLALLLGYEFFQYWYHRLSHELGGSAGRFLWRVHAAHHLPDRVYVLMHVVGHPLNFLLVRWVIYAGMVYLPGFSPEAVLLMNIVMGVNGAFSHFNMNIRAGWFNYLFISTELHRYHHSADLSEAKNYGAITPFWDMTFGTFIYKPGGNPSRLGVDRPESYPRSEEFWKVVFLPFKP
jgi:sterol desaturase/sphingolipid hydroxylase (fatty acid hydroxylase superfamily)